MKPKTYTEAGVDIARGENIVAFIRQMKSSAVAKGIGGFASPIPFNQNQYKEPLLLSTSDGIGTKILVAKRLDRYHTIGIDLVAMTVNDLLACGGEPLAFQDYIACGKIHNNRLEDLLAGIVKGCEIAGCVLNGGETAEMPDMYGEDDFDLAGFCVGVVEKNELLPHVETIQPEDILLGLPSTGLHSNGFSMARKVLDTDEEWEEMLTPTQIYSAEMRSLLKTGHILAAAHITGGGLIGNIQRILPTHLHADLRYDWHIPWIFERIEKKSGATQEEMRMTFNLGIGMVLVVPQDKLSDVVLKGDAKNISLFPIGQTKAR